jgi:predicted ATPase
MIRRIRIEGYKSLADVELNDLPRLVLLFGANAAGKSNLLDALDLLAHLVREDTLIHAFQSHRGNRLGRPIPVRWFFHGHSDDKSPREIRFEVDLELHPRIVADLNRELEERERAAHLERPYTRVTRSRLRYELKIAYIPESRVLQVVHEALTPLRKDGTPYGEATAGPFIKSRADSRQISVKLERQGHPRYYDLPRSRTLLSEIGDPVNHPHIVAASRELRAIRVYYVEPARMRAAVSDIQATDPGSHGEQLASFYHWLKREHPIGMKNLVHNLKRIVPNIDGVDVREAAEGFLELWVSEQGRDEFPAGLISEGTLRLLCMLGIAATPAAPPVVGYEEPENGVNPARLAEMLSILENAATAQNGPQFILTTHSPDVINYFAERTVFQAQQTERGSVFTRFTELPLFAADAATAVLGAVPKRSSPLGTRFNRGDLG